MIPPEATYTPASAGHTNTAKVQDDLKSYLTKIIDALKREMNKCLQETQKNAMK